MIKIIQILLIFFLFLEGNVPVLANPVAGLYSPPSLSVRFERDTSFAFLPIGWSKEGNFALLINHKEKSEVRLIISNTVEDSILYDSGSMILEGTNLGSFWRTNGDLFSSALSSGSILPDNNPSYGSLDFSLGDEKYHISTKRDFLIGNRAISSLSLNIQSERRGVKTMYTYRHDDSDNSFLMDFTILGYFKSPWEKRVAVISVEDLYSESRGSQSSVRLSGGHLTIGYVKANNPDVKLIDAVLSGQFYTTRRFLEEGGNPNQVVSGAYPLIIMAAMQNNWELVFLLLENGADPAVTGEKKKTLLHYAALYGDESIVLQLLNMGMNRDFKDAEGKTPGDIAREEGHEKLLNHL